MRLVYANGVEARHGDVLRIARNRNFIFSSGIFSHWGIYDIEPDGAYIIHYSAPDSHNDFKGVVMKTPVEKFMAGDITCINKTNAFPNGFSGEETAERARSKIGMGGYDLLCQNCEHFAVWCKTGEAKSSQTEILEPIQILSKGIVDIIGGIFDDKH